MTCGLMRRARSAFGAPGFRTRRSPEARRSYGENGGAVAGFWSPVALLSHRVFYYSNNFGLETVLPLRSFDLPFLQVSQ